MTDGKLGIQPRTIGCYASREIRFLTIVSFLDNFKFRHIIQKYYRDKYVKSFTCRNQLLEMMFAQLIDKSIYDMLKKQDINLTHKILLTELLDKSKINNLKNQIDPSETNLFNF